MILPTPHECVQIAHPSLDETVDTQQRLRPTFSANMVTPPGSLPLKKVLLIARQGLQGARWASVTQTVTRQNVAHQCGSPENCEKSPVHHSPVEGAPHDLVFFTANIIDEPLLKHATTRPIPNLLHSVLRLLLALIVGV